MPYLAQAHLWKCGQPCGLDALCRFCTRYTAGLGIAWRGRHLDGTAPAAHHSGGELLTVSLAGSYVVLVVRATWTLLAYADEGVPRPVAVFAVAPRDRALRALAHARCRLSRAMTARRRSMASSR